MHELLCAYVLGEASDEERARVEAALEGSSELRAERERIEATIGLVQTAFPAATAGDEGDVLAQGTAERLLAQARSGAGSAGGNVIQGPWQRLSRSPMLKMAAAILVMTGAYASYRAFDRGAYEATSSSLLDGNARDTELARADNAPASAATPDANGFKGGKEEAARLSQLGYTGRASEQKREGGERQAEDRLARHKESIVNGEASGEVFDDPAEPQFEAEIVAGGQVQEELELGAMDSPNVGAPVQLQDQLRQLKLQKDANSPSVYSLQSDEKIAQEIHKNTIMISGGAGGQATPPADSPYKGAGDSVPPQVKDGSAEHFLGYGVSTSREAPALLASKATPTGGAGGAGSGPQGNPGPASPGPPAAATSPAPAPMNSPGPSANARNRARTTLGLDVHLRDEAVDKKKDLDAVEALRGLGYVDGEADADRRGRGGNDDFFLGSGERRASRFDRIRTLTPEQFDAYVARECQRVIQGCRAYPGEHPREMFFRFWGDNPFELAQLDHLSTFSVDVDTASYALARRYLKEGHLPTKAQIRTEEFVNYFKPDIPAPNESTFAISTELAPSRFSATESFGFGSPVSTGPRWMLRVGLRGREVSREERLPLSLTFVIDTSGSMKENGRLELVKHALRLLIGELDGLDSIAIVAFSREARLILPMTTAANRGVIEAALYGLRPDGGTNAEAGLLMGYEASLSTLNSNAHNRVVLLSDGVANIGETDQNRINETVRRHREQGIYLNTIGVGMSNHNDVFLEQLANKGDGLCNYIDSAEEARRALVENFTGAFETIARNVKIQVEFDPAHVYRYRLLGYENRAVADKDFRNDAVDAGEVGAGHQVIALYELELTTNDAAAQLANVQVRWLPPVKALTDGNDGQAIEIAQPVTFASATGFEGASAGYRRSILVAQFAEILRRSVHARGESYDELVLEAEKLAAELADPDFTEFVGLLKTCRQLILANLPRQHDLGRALDAYRYNHYLGSLRGRIERLEQADRQAAAAADTADTGDAAEILRQIEARNAELEAAIQKIIRGSLEEKRRK